MAIDWNKDVEGEFGDTRRRLYPLKNELGEVIAVDDLHRVWRLDSPDCPRVRNVDPKPVQHECFVNLYDDGYIGNGVGGYKSKDDADASVNVYKNRVECRRIVWHSDGSPVEGVREPLIEPLTAWRNQIAATEKVLQERDEVEANLAAMKCDLIDAKAERDVLKAECEQWKEKAEKMLDLLTQMNDERERLISDMEKHIVKSCDNCANSPQFSPKCETGPCIDASNWEPKR